MNFRLSRDMYYLTLNFKILLRCYNSSIISNELFTEFMDIVLGPPEFYNDTRDYILISYGDLNRLFFYRTDELNKFTVPFHRHYRQINFYFNRKTFKSIEDYVLQRQEIRRYYNFT